MEPEFLLKKKRQFSVDSRLDRSVVLLLNVFEFLRIQIATGSVSSEHLMGYTYRTYDILLSRLLKLFMKFPHEKWSSILHELRA